ncbi:Histone-lysine N-methyltransferase ASHH2 [Auxenochlorella protothecoides]|uniref:Histone-lysine N-methyltransferase ASHH2 n=2 Tax=Auxenochlorella protothecoides TaxID=3075 RepID=A0A087SAW4_AUXPR|nr:Histone-lysine N-methyltransferase ASHH2 [Auxenochlorella protothecoides]KFM22868.1 Histone-lysine N-methyltransferase ASHH2 [Auxenochlorella protothecoides]
MPQELSDAEIDENNTPADAQSALSPRATKAPLASHPPVWQLIAEKIYTHRPRRVQEEDDIMICQCKHIWPSDTTSIGCGEHCLNRMLNIECVAEYCPCGDRCTNQQFTKREYAALDVLRAGAKGFGLFTRDGVRAGQFIVEYVGEVLEEDEYQRRKEYYIASNQRHYYFMNIGNGEVIDACRRGGQGRFINHSCDPNCETQKWLVEGELSIGLFAIKDVPPGGELTFDYNFERYGDKPMACLCGSANCRGVIGGTQETAVLAPPVVVPEYEDDPEPIMVSGVKATPTLERLLDRIVGVGSHAGLTSGERSL